MKQTERQKMASGEWYTCLDSELNELRLKASEAVHEHSIVKPNERGLIAPKLFSLLGSVGNSTLIMPGFHCAYGFNIHIGPGVFLNVGCTILDTAPVHIGARTLLGPNVQIYCAEHHLDRKLRSQGLEIGKPVTIGEDVWIGGSAIILPGVSIGDGAIVGAGSVVTKSVPEGITVVGNPARVMS